jgi:hypothetical protein
MKKEKAETNRQLKEKHGGRETKKDTMEEKCKQKK